MAGEEGVRPLAFAGIAMESPTLRGAPGTPAAPSGMEVRLATGDVLVLGTPSEAWRRRGGTPLLGELRSATDVAGATREGGALPSLSGQTALPPATFGQGALPPLQNTTGVLPPLSGAGGAPAVTSGEGGLPSLQGGQGLGNQGTVGGQGGAGGNPFLTPPSPAPLVGGTGGLGTLGQTPVGDLAVWKTFDLTTAFGFSQFPLGRLEYPGNWLVQVDTFNRTVTFAEDASGLVFFTIAPGASVQVSTARDLAIQVATLLAANVPDLALAREEFREDPSLKGSGYALTFGRFLLVGTFQGRAVTAMVQTYVMASQMAGSMPFGLGTAMVCTAPRELFDQRLQSVFNRMITSYEGSVNKPSKKD